MKVTCYPLLALLLTSGCAVAQAPTPPIVITRPVISAILAPQPSICDSDYRQTAKEKFQDVMDAVDRITPQLTDARIAELEQEEVPLYEPVFGPGEPVTYEKALLVSKHNDELRRTLMQKPDYVAWQIRRNSAILAYARDHIGEVDFRDSDDSDNGQFFQLRGDIELLLSVQRTVNTLIVLKGHTDAAEPGSISAGISTALESLLNVARCNTKLASEKRHQ